MTACFDELNDAVAQCLMLISQAQQSQEESREHAYSSLSNNESIHYKRLKTGHFQGYERRRALRRLERALAFIKSESSKHDEDSIQHESKAITIQAEYSLLLNETTVDNLVAVLAIILPNFCIFGDDGFEECVLMTCCELLVNQAQIPLPMSHLERLLDQVANTCTSNTTDAAKKYLEQLLSVINTFMWLAHEQNYGSYDVTRQELVRLTDLILGYFKDKFTSENSNNNSIPLRRQVIVFATLLLQQLSILRNTKDDSISHDKRKWHELSDDVHTFLLHVIDVAVDSLDRTRQTLNLPNNDAIIQSTIDDCGIAVNLIEVLKESQDCFVSCPPEFHHALLDALLQLILNLDSHHFFRNASKELYLRLIYLAEGYSQSKWIASAFDTALLLINEENVSFDAHSIIKQVQRQPKDHERIIQLCAMSQVCMPSPGDDLMLLLNLLPQQSTQGPWQFLLEHMLKDEK